MRRVNDLAATGLCALLSTATTSRAAPVSCEIGTSQSYLRLTNPRPGRMRDATSTTNPGSPCLK